MKETKKMKSNSRKISVYQLVVFAFLLAAVSLRTVALFIDYDFATGYFDSKTCITVGNVLLLTGVFMSFASIFVFKRTPGLVASFDGAATYIPSGVVAVALMFVGAGLFRDIIKLPEKLLSKESLTDVKVLFMLVLTALAVLGVGAFLYNSLSDKRADSNRGAFYIVLVVFLMLYSAYLYFSTKLPINAHVKIVDQMAYMMAAIFFLYETRISMDRPIWHAYIAFGLIAALLTAYSSLPSLIVYFVNGRIISASIYESVLTFALFIFISARLILLTELKSAERCPAAMAAHTFAENREAARAAAEEARAHALENKEEISAEADTEPSNYTMDIDDSITTTGEAE